MQLDAGAPRVLLVAYDSAAAGPLATMSPSEGLLGVAMVLERQDADGGEPLESAAPLATLSLSLQPGDAEAEYGALGEFAGRNAMAPALALLDALANARASCLLPAGQDATLRVELAHG